MPAEPLVVVRELTKTFLHMGNELEVLRGIDLDIHEGEVVAIVGKSGAGKSTLLQCIGTLDLPSSGIIRLGSEYLVGMSREALADIRNRMIGFVFQFHHLLPEFNALENVMMPGLIQGLPRADIEKRARDLLTDVGLADRATHRPGELSGGEQQRVALARALVLEPKLILADEPTGNLDSATSEAIHNLFFDINKKRGTTIVVVTHNTKLAEQMPRIIRMLDGLIADDDLRHDDGSNRDAPEPYQVDEAVLERSRALSKVRYAGFWHRGAVRFADMLVMNALAFGAGYATGLVAQLAGAELHHERLLDWHWAVPAWLLVNIAVLAYHSVAEAMGGATFGKMLFGLRVKNESLDRSGLLSGVLRNILMMIDSILFGLVAYVGMRGSLMRQRFGDGVAQTVVVEANTLPQGDDSGVLAGAVLGVLVFFVLTLLVSLGFWLL